MAKYSCKWQAEDKLGRRRDTGRLINARNVDEAKAKVKKQFKNVSFVNCKLIK